MRDNLPLRLTGENGEGGRRNLFCEDNLHLVAFVFVFVEADVVLFAKNVEDANDGGLRLAFALLVFPDGIGMDAELLGHLVLIEVQLLAREDEFFAKAKFGHSEFLSLEPRFPPLAQRMRQGWGTRICD